MVSAPMRVKDHTGATILYHRRYYDLNDSGAAEGRVGPHCRPEVVNLKSAKRRLLTGIRSEVSDERLISAVARVPREMFVAEESIHLAYENTPLPIVQGQTISQPLIMALMLDALELRRTDRILELGTSSGYQATLISELADTAISVEHIGSLANDAHVRLRSGGFHAVEVVDVTQELVWQQGCTLRCHHRIGRLRLIAHGTHQATRTREQARRPSRLPRKPGTDEGDADRRLLFGLDHGGLPIRASDR